MSEPDFEAAAFFAKNSGRAMNNEIRLSLSEARERDDADVNWRERAIADQVAPANEPYTPPAPVAAWLAKYDTEKPPTRNYAAILEAAKRKPVGYWADAPKGIQFGGGSTEKGTGLTKAEGLPPDTTQRPATPADGPYEPVGTVPVVGDEAVSVNTGRHFIITSYNPSCDVWYAGNACLLGESFGYGNICILKRRKTPHASR